MTSSKANKQEIITRAKRLVRHRERMMLQYGASPKLKTVSAILNRLDFFSERDAKAICRVIISMRDEIESILAGKTSKFYRSDQKKAYELFTICDQTLNQTN
jgi:hypothetical protein